MGIKERLHKFEGPITPQELSEILKVPVSWVYRAGREGILRQARLPLGKYVLFDGPKVADVLSAPEQVRSLTTEKKVNRKARLSLAVAAKEDEWLR